MVPTYIDPIKSHEAHQGMHHEMPHGPMNERLAMRVGVYGETIEVLRDELKGHGSTTVATYLEDLALRADRMSDRLRQGDYRGAAHEVRRFAADHPELFLGVVFAGGAIAGRFIGEAIHTQKMRALEPVTRPAGMMTDRTLEIGYGRE